MFVHDFFHHHFVFVAVFEVLQYVVHKLFRTGVGRHKQPVFILLYERPRIEFVFDQVVLPFVVLPIYFLPVEVVPNCPRHVPQLQPSHFVLVLFHKVNVARVHARLQRFGRFFDEGVAHDVVPGPHDARLEYAAHLLVRLPVAGPREPGVPIIHARPLFKSLAALIPEPRKNVHDLFVKIHVNAVSEQLHKVLAPRVQQFQRVGGPVRAVKFHVGVNPCKRLPVGGQQASHS